MDMDPKLAEYLDQIVRDYETPRKGIKRYLSALLAFVEYASLIDNIRKYQRIPSECNDEIRETLSRGNVELLRGADRSQQLALGTIGFLAINNRYDAKKASIIGSLGVRLFGHATVALTIAYALGFASDRLGDDRFMAIPVAAFAAAFYVMDVRMFNPERHKKYWSQD